MTEAPLVSVITPTFNADRFLDQTIESVLGQSYRRLELVVVDGGSTDRTLEIVEHHRRRDPDRIRLLRERPGSGVWFRRNRGLLHSDGALVCHQDADDLWLPDKLERQVDLMLSRPDLGLVYSYFEAFDSDTGSVLDWSDARHDWEGDLLVPLWVKGCFIAAQTAMVRRSVLDPRKLRLGNERFQFGDDFWVWLAVSLDHPIARTDRVLARYRRHDDNASTRFAEANASLSTISLMREFLKAFPRASERLGAWRRVGFARQFAHAGAHEAAHSHRLRALRYRFHARRLSRRAFLPEADLDRLIQRHSGATKLETVPAI
jgi:glycosyltransferase involved in cell wall biosynthesis